MNQHNLNKRFNRHKSCKALDSNMTLKTHLYLRVGPEWTNKTNGFQKHPMWSGVEGPLTPDMFETNIAKSPRE